VKLVILNFLLAAFERIYLCAQLQVLRLENLKLRFELRVRPICLREHGARLLREGYTVEQIEDMAQGDPRTLVELRRGMDISA